MDFILDKIHENIPISDPILIFSLVLFVILSVPLLLDKLRIPHIIGLIMSGAALGENGFGLLKCLVRWASSTSCFWQACKWI